MAYVFAEGGYGAAATVIHTDPSHPDVISISDAELLRDGTLHRVGTDLHLKGHAGQHVVISGYFASEHPAALVGPDGGRLNADLVAQLAGHEQLAAAQPTTANDATSHFDHSAIGHVDKITGDVTVERNGVSVTLHAGDAVYKSDVIQTGGGSAVAISFADGTAVHLAANTRMVLTSYSFDPTSDSNDALFTLTDGTFAFVGGKIAHDGTIRIATDVATMRVHEGTFGWAHHLTASEISSISAKLGSVSYAFAVVNEHGANTHGMYDLLVKDGVIGNVDDPNLVSYLDSDGNLITMPFDHSGELATDLPQDLLQWLDEDVATRSLQGIHGSGGAIDLPSFPTPINLNQLGPTFDFDPNAGGGLFSGLLNPANNDFQPIFITHSNLFIWNGFGDWDLNPLNWQAGFAPTSAADTVIIQSGKSNYNNFYSVGSLTVDSGATLNIASGSLTVGGLANAGLIEINSSGVDPALIMNGAIDLTGGGTIEMLGPTADNFILGVDSSSSLVNVDNLIEGSGNIGAGDGHLTFVNEATVDATPLLPSDSGLLIINTGNPVANFGTFEATLKGELKISDQLFNFNLVEAVGVGSSVLIDNNSRDTGSVPGNAGVNTGLIEAISGGTVTIEDSTIVNAGTNAEGAIVDGIIEAGAGSRLLFSNAAILKGFVTVAVGGEIQTLSGTSNLVDTTNGSHNATQFTIINDGLVLVNDNSSLTLGSASAIGNAGTIEVDSTGDETRLLFTEPLAVLSGGGDIILEGAVGGEPEPGFMPLAERESVKGGIAQNIIDGVAGAGFSTVTLENLDNTISGSGSIGEGTTALALKNDAQGTVDANLFGQTLRIDTGANTIVNAGLFEATNGGLLEIESALDNSGKVIAQQRSEVLITADVTNESGGKIAALGSGADVSFWGSSTDPLTVDNSGVIAARGGGTVFFDFTNITNEGAGKSAPAGRIVASGAGSRVEIENSTVDNSGVIKAKHGGAVDFDNGSVTNETDGRILATGKGSDVSFFGSSADPISVDNSGVIAARNGGTVSFDLADITNKGASETAPAGHIVATGAGSLVEIEDSTVDNGGVIKAKRGGTVDFDNDKVTNEADGLILATGKESEVSFDHDHVDNSGDISAKHRGEVVFKHSHVDNDKGGTIEADGRGSKVKFEHDRVYNSGLIEAIKHGEVDFDKSHIDNESGGTIEADGRGSKVKFEHDRVHNSGLIEAINHSEVDFDKSHIDNEKAGTIEADGRGSTVRFDRDHVDNSGLIEAINHGEVDFDKSHIDNDKRGTIEADGRGSKVRFDHDQVDNSGLIEAEHHGEVEFRQSFIDNDRRGVIKADGQGSEVKFDRDFVLNAGRIEAKAGGKVDIDESIIGNDGSGRIEADGKGSKVRFDYDGVGNWGEISANSGGSVLFEKSWIENGRGGEIEADGLNSEVTFDRSHIDNSGSIEAERGGEVEFDRSHIDNEWHAVIEADGRGSEVRFDRDHVDNSGRIEAERGGKVEFDESHVDNDARGTIGADGRGSKVKFERDGVNNSGEISANWRGSVLFEESWISNERGGELEADGKGSEVNFDRSHIDNSGRIEAERGGDVEFDKSHIDNDKGGTIEADGHGSTVRFDRDHVDNSGHIKAEDHGEVEFDKSHVDNDGRGTIEADGPDSKVKFERDGVNNSGEISANWDGSVLFEESWISNERGGEIEADGKGSEVSFEHSHIDNSGRIEAHHGGEVDFDGSHVDNDRYGTIEAKGWGSEISFDHAHVDNSGHIKAEDHGEVEFDKSHIDNDGRGTIEADGPVSKVKFERDTIKNWGSIGATWGGLVDFDQSWISNQRGSEIEADGKGSEVSFEYSHIDNAGRIEADHGGKVEFDKSHVDNDRHGEIEADGSGSKIKFERDGIKNWGWIGATSAGQVQFDESWIDNGHRGKIEADGKDSVVAFDHDHIDNSGRIEAERGGTVTFDRSHVDNDGTIEARWGGAVNLDHSHIDNWHGTIEAFGSGSTVNLDDAYISGGDLTDGFGGLIKAAVGTSTLHDVTITSGSEVDVGATLRLTGKIENSGSTITLGLRGELDLVWATVDGGLIQGGEMGGIDVYHVNTLENLTVAVSDMTVESGATLHIEKTVHLDGVTVHNDGAIIVDLPTNPASATLLVDDGAAIVGGQLTINPYGTLEIELGKNPSNASGAMLDGVTVTDDGSIDIGSTATLIVNDGTVISGSGTLTVESDSMLDVEHGSGNGPNYGATLDGLAVSLDDRGDIEVGHLANGAVLTLTDGTTVTGSGWLTIEQFSTLDVLQGKNGGATLDGTQVTVAGTFNVGDGSAFTQLALVDGATIGGSGGTLTINTYAIVEVEKSTVTGLNYDASLSGLDVADNGAIDVAAGAVLAIGGGTDIAGSGVGTLKINQGSTVDVEKTATLDGVLVTADGTLLVGKQTATTLTLSDGTVVSGGGELLIDSGGTVDVEQGAGTYGDGATFDGLAVTDKGALDVGDVLGGAVLKLDDGTTISGNGTGTLTVNSGSALDVEAGAGTGSHGAMLDGVNVIGANGLEPSIIEVGQTSTATLTLDDGTSISGGKLLLGNAGNSTVGTLDVEAGAGTGSHGATLDGLQVTQGGTGLHVAPPPGLSNITNAPSTSVIEVGQASTATLTLDDGTSIADSSLLLGSADGTGTLDVESSLGATLSNVAVTGAGSSNSIEVAQASASTLALKNGTSINNASLTIGVSGFTGTVDVESSSIVTFMDVTISAYDQTDRIEVGQTATTTLQLDDGSSMTGGTLALGGVGSIGTVDVEMTPGAALHGVNVTANSASSGIEVGAGGVSTLTMDDGTAMTGGSLVINLNSALDVEAGSATAGNHGATLHGVKVTDAGTLYVGENLSGAELTLEDGASIVGAGTGSPTIVNNGTLDIEKGTTGPGATLDGLSVSNSGTVDVGTNATLTIGDTVTLNGTGAVSMASGSKITDSGSTAILDNAGNTISGQGTIGGSHLQLNNQGVIDADVAGQALILDTNSTVTNNGLLEATNGATLDIQSNVDQGGSLAAGTAGSIEAHGSKSIVELEAVTVTSGKILIDAGNTLEIENGKTTLTGVDVENNGNLQIDTSAATATLVLGTGSSIDGGINIGATGELDISGGTFNGNVTIYDSGVFDINTALTLSHDVTIVLQGGSFLDTGLLTVADGARVKLSGANNFGTLDIGNGSVLTLDNANASFVDFAGHVGTLVLKEPSGFTGTIKGLASGDVIDLAGVKANTVTLDGTTLKINGVATSFSIAGGLPANDVLVFKDDGSGGTDIKVEAPIITISGGTVSGVEGSAISLDFGAAWTDTVSTMTISGIPADAKLIDSYGHVYFPSNGSVTMAAGAALSSGLWIVPGDDNNFNLSLTLTGNDSDGYQYSATTTETVTVTPPQPSVSWAAGAAVGDASGGKVAIALNAIANGATGDHNSIKSVLISGIPLNAVLSDGTHNFTATANSMSVDVASWDLSKLTITPANASNFTLTATVTEKDGDEDTSTAVANLKIGTTTDWTHTGALDSNANWSTAADWDNGVPNSGLNAVFDHSVTDATGLYSVTVSTYATAEAYTLTLNDADAILYDRGLLTVDSAATIDAGWIGIESADFDGAANAAATMKVSGPLTIHGGEIDVMGGVYFGTGSWPGGTLNVTGDIIVDGGKLVIEPGSNSNTGALANPGGTLDAGSINVKTGGSVELHGIANVTGVIETTGGTLTIGSDTQFTKTQIVTFGGTSGTIKFVDTTTQTYSAPHIARFGSSDVVDLADFDPTKATFSESVSNGNLVLTATQGGETTTLTFNNYTGGLHFATDGSGGTDITVGSQTSTFTVSGVSGTEGSAIALNLPTAVNGNNLKSITISGIPADAALFSAGVKLTVTGGSITLTAAQLAGLTLTPGDDANFSLSLTATVSDGAGGQYQATATEAVTVSPPAPTVNWAAGAQIGDVTGAKIGIALTAGLNGATSDHNVITAETISGLQVGATLTDGTNTFKATAGNTTANVLNWNLANLSITPANASNFTLTATVTEADSDNPAQTSTASASLNIVTNTDWTHAGTLDHSDNGEADWTTAGDWDHGAPSSAVNAVFDSSITGSTAWYIVKIAAGTTAEVHGLTFNDAWTDLLDYGHLTVDTAFTENAGYIVVENSVFGGGKNNAATMTVSGGLTVHGGTIEVIGGTNVSGTNWASGTLTISGALVVDGGKVVTDAGTSTSGGTNAPGGTLTATSINVETGGTVELHGPVNVSGVIETTGGNLIVGSEAQFNNTKVLTFGGTSGTITIEDNSSAAYKAPDIAGFGAGDVVDLASFDPTQTVFSESMSNGNLVLTATDGGAVTTLTFDNFHGGLNFASDGRGGTDITYSTHSQTYWTQAKSTDWNANADWSAGVPTSNLEALIENSVTQATHLTAYTIKITSHDVAYALTMNDTYATLNDNNSLTITGSLSLSAGTINVGDADTLTAGSTTVGGGLIDVTGDDWGGVFNAGALAVNGGKVLIEAGDFWDAGGTLNASSVNVETGGTVELHGTVHVTGVIETTGGNLIVGSDTDFIGTDTLTFGASGGTVTFDTSSSWTYTAPDISGFGHGGAHPDVVDLADYDLSQTVFTESSSNGNLVLTATENGNATTLTFDNFNGTLNFAADGNGGIAISGAAEASAADIGTVDTSVSSSVVTGTITATDPHSSGTVTTTLTPDGANYIGNFSVDAETSSHNVASVAFSFNTGGAQIKSAVTQSYDVAVSEGANTILHETVSVSVGSSHSDNFVFSPGIGADTIINFNASGGDTIDLTHFTNITTVAQLQAATTTDAHGDEVINLGNHDSITIAGMNATQFQHVMGSAFHLA